MKQINDEILKREFYTGMTRFDKSNIHIAQYLTVLLEKKLLEAKLH